MTKESRISNVEKGQIIFSGVVNAFAGPGFALGATMIGFSVIAKEAGFDLAMTIATTAMVWGMPGQVAFASLFAVGAPLVFIFLAVSLANMRMMLMVISGFSILEIEKHNLSFWKKMCLMHVMAITSWAQIGLMKESHPFPKILYYYIGFALTIFAFGMTGTVFGFFLGEFIPPNVLRIVVFVTPLYILLLVVNSKQTVNRLAVILGGLLSPLLYPVLGNWTILFSGIIGGTVAFYFKFGEKNDL